MRFTVNTTFRRVAAGATLAIAPALLAVGVAASSQASSVISNGIPTLGPQIHAGQNYAGGATGTVVKPGTPEHHHHQKNKAKK
jgi:hypothetical protein